jgi:cell division protein FtsL
MVFENVNLFRRAKEKDYVERTLLQYATRLEEIQSELKNVNRAHEALTSKHDRLTSEHDKLASEQNKLGSKHDKLAVEHYKLTSEHDKLASEHGKLQSEHDKVAAEHSKLQSEHDKVAAEHSKLQSEHDKLASKHGKLQSECSKLAGEYGKLQSEHDKLKSSASVMVSIILRQLEDSNWFGKNERYYYAQRGNRLRILRIPIPSDPPAPLLSRGANLLAPLRSQGQIDTVDAALLDEDGNVGPWETQPWLLEPLRTKLELYRAALSLLDRPPVGMKAKAIGADTSERFFEQAMAVLRMNPELVDFVANAWLNHVVTPSGAPAVVSPPFDEPDTLPPFSVSAEPRRKSVVFVHNSYYHFNTLAQALRRRGWDALTVSVEPLDSPQRQFYVGEDLNLYHEDQTTRRRQISEFLRALPERFGALHFYGQGLPTFFGENMGNSAKRTKVPWDFLELRRHGVTIGYMPSGCLDGGRQSSIRRVAKNVCGRCVWELRPDVCSDAKNGAWADTIDAVCDWIGIEGDFAVDERMGPKFVWGPVVTALDPEYWRADLVVDDTKRVPREDGDILVYHAVGNVAARRASGRDIKGSGAVEAAIEKLRAEGVPLKLFFAQDLPITEVRYYKAQADIVVDQLNYGRIGANARESFMMGKPVITRLMPEQQSPLPPLRSVVEAPALDASEATVEAVLRKLAFDPDLRRKMSQSSREYAMRWYAAEECARRYEMVIDRVRRGLPPETEELYPQPLSPDAASRTLSAISRHRSLSKRA